jgi:RNA polymerase sigma-70 factor (ECF subfamily)
MRSFLKETVMNDAKLVDLLKHNPSKGLELAVDKYSGLVKTIVVRIIGYDRQEDVEETVSDVFVELWKSIDNFDSEKGQLKNYIISIARFVSLNTYNRKILKHDLIPLEEDEFEFDVDLDNEVSKSINKEIIKVTIKSLPHPDKDIFIRRYYLFESVKEIAQNLNLTPKSVENKLYRGKEKLKAALIENGIII